MKQLAEEPGGQSYADALRKLFGLDPKAVEAVTRADVATDPTRRRCVMTAALRLGTRRSALAIAQSELVAADAHRAHRPGRRAGPGHDVRRHLPRGARPDRRHRRLRLRAARRAARRRRRPRRALAQGPADRRRRRHPARRGPAARGPARRAGGPRRARPGRAARRLPGRHRLAATGRPAARPRPRPRGRGRARQRRHPAPAGRATARSTPSSWPAPGSPGSAGSTPSPR